MMTKKMYQTLRVCSSTTEICVCHFPGEFTTKKSNCPSVGDIERESKIVGDPIYLRFSKHRLLP